MAGRALCEVKLKAPKEKAAAKALAVDEFEGRGPVGDVGEAAPLLPVAPFLIRSRRSWRALARAFSCVRTN